MRKFHIFYKEKHKLLSQILWLFVTA